MGDEASRAELAALAEEAGEHLSYLRELGVEFLESAGTIETHAASAQFDSRSAAAQSHVAPDTRRSAALRRNAEAGARVEGTPPADVPRASPPQTLPQPTHAPPTRREEQKTETPRDVLYQSSQTTSTERAEMPTKRKPVRTPDAVPPPPQETLFGEITPKDELSLPREGETYEDIRNDIGECMRCPLCCEGRSKVVHSEGNPKARLMFVGEAPGADEDASGRPFVGRAGQLLNKIVEAIGMKREDVFIGNVNRCRPAGNRTPTTAEAATCKPFLLREIALLRPEVIVVLGNTAMKNLLDTKEGITKLRGNFMDYKGIKVMPTFHPAYLLRDPSKKRETWEDMKKVREYLNKTKSDK
ncbi:MAG TPA: uracil-DNA glycosylase family protein [Pyrinomonadaceae bacterium]|nr:uracil-DNA glycosylase family protein [Pyrinomonadaceae bacterium]